jgi:hypothetical protein
MKLRSQQGNTFVGIVIGLVIGLAIAVVVALVITKGSTPFTDKGKAEQDGRNHGGPGGRSEQADVRQQGSGARSGQGLSREGSACGAQGAGADPLQAVVDKIQATPAAPAPPLEKPKTAAAPAAPGASNVTPQPVARAPAAPMRRRQIHLLSAGWRLP